METQCIKWCEKLKSLGSLSVGKKPRGCPRPGAGPASSGRRCRRGPAGGGGGGGAGGGAPRRPAAAGAGRGRGAATRRAARARAVRARRRSRAPCRCAPRRPPARCAAARARARTASVCRRPPCPPPTPRATSCAGGCRGPASLAGAGSGAPLSGRRSTRGPRRWERFRRALGGRRQGPG